MLHESNIFPFSHPKRYIKKNVSKKQIRRNGKKLSKRFYKGLPHGY